MDWLRKYNPRIDWVDSQLCFDDAGTARYLHACMQMQMARMVVSLYLAARFLSQFAPNWFLLKTGLQL